MCVTVDAIAAVIETGRMSETQAGSGAKAEGAAGGKGDSGKLEPPPPGGSYAGIPRADFIVSLRFRFSPIHQCSYIFLNI